MQVSALFIDTLGIQGWMQVPFIKSIVNEVAGRNAENKSEQ